MRKQRTHKLVRSVALALAAATALAVVGGGPAVAKPTGTPVKLMLITELSSGVTTPELPNGAKAAVKALDKKDGIDGHPVTLTVCDTKNDPNTATACGQQAVDGKYLAVVGSQTVQAGKYLPVIQAAQIPSVGNNAADASDFVSPASFPLSGGLVSTPGGLAEALADAGAKKISVGYIDLPQGAIIPTLVDMALKRYNLQVQNKVAIPAGAPDLASYVEAATANGTDGIVLAITGQDAINFIQSYIASGKTGVKFALITTDAAAVLKAIKGQKLDFYGAISYDRRNKQFLADMKAAGYKNPVGQEIVSYAAVMAVANLAKGMTPLDGPTLYAKIPTVTDLDLGSIMPIVDFTKAGTAIALAPRVPQVCIKVTKLNKTDFAVQSKNWIDAYTGAECPAG
ncbi:MAG TPA: ABC transporter substrate-binding protein [Acidimicrobiia bacterium]|nr:ABC transporter substrate-binding protein [Acidimicrobiia bacterium]